MEILKDHVRRFIITMKDDISMQPHLTNVVTEYFDRVGSIQSRHESHRSGLG